MKELKRILPDFPRTPHLPFKPNVSEGDIVSKDSDVSGIFTDKAIFVEEKIDGGNCGMCLFQGNAVIRNRNHILKKGYLKDTPAKLQFRPTWGWFYENKKRFEQINKAVGYDIGIYGEWVYALHGIRYDKLPDLFIAYDLYDSYAGKFIDTATTRKLLIAAGFSVPPLLHTGKVESWEQLEVLCNEASAFSTTDQREGLYLKISDGNHVTARFKMIRDGYVQGCNWDVRTITKNKLVSS